MRQLDGRILERLNDEHALKVKSLAQHIVEAASSFSLDNPDCIGITEAARITSFNYYLRSKENRFMDKMGFAYKTVKRTAGLIVPKAAIYSVGSTSCVGDVVVTADAKIATSKDFAAASVASGLPENEIVVESRYLRLATELARRSNFDTLVTYDWCRLTEACLAVPPDATM